MSDMTKKDKKEINDNYDKMKKAISAWVESCGRVPSDMKRAFDIFEAASTGNEVVKRRSMSTVRGDYRVLLNLIQIGVIDRVYEHPDDDFNFKMRVYDLEQAQNKDLIKDFSWTEDKSINIVHWPALFPTRNGSLVDADTETVIAEVVKARTDMAALIDGISNGDDISDIYTIPTEDISAEKKAELSNLELLALHQEYAMGKVEQVIEEWAKTLVLETKPLTSITPDNHNLSFGSTLEILSQNAPVSKLRQYRRAFGEKFDSKNKEGVLNARHKVKWSGKLENAPVINYTPQPRAKKGGSKK